MGSIPLLATQIRTPTPADPLAEYARAAGLKTQLQEQQMQQQQIQQRDQQLRDQQATTKAMLGWDGKSYDDLAKGVLTNGGSATAAQAIQQHGLAIKDTASQIASRDAETGSKHIDTIVKQHDVVNGALQSLDGVPDAELGGRITELTKQFADQGLLEPELAQKAQQISQLPPDQARQQLKLFEKNLIGQKTQFEQAKELTSQKIDQQKADQGEWKEAGQGTLVNVRTGQLIHGVAPVDQQELQDYLKKHPSKGPADFAAWKATLAPQAQVNVQMGAGGPGGPLSDTVIDALAAPGAKLKLSDVLPPRAPLAVKQAAIKQVLTKYPDFSSADYDVEKGVMKDFASGPDAQKLQAFNTAITHMGIFKDAADALDNGDVKVLNRAGNALGAQFGSDKSTNFNIAKQAFIGEVTRAFDGAGVTMHDREQVENQVSAASSPSQLKGAADTAEKLLRGKRDVLKQQYEAGKGGKANFGEPGSGGSGLSVTAPNGKTYNFKDQASADAFKKAAGIQ